MDQTEKQQRLLDAGSGTQKAETGLAIMEGQRVFRAAESELQRGQPEHRMNAELPLFQKPAAKVFKRQRVRLYEREVIVEEPVPHERGVRAAAANVRVVEEQREGSLDAAAMSDIATTHVDGGIATLSELRREGEVARPTNCVHDNDVRTESDGPKPQKRNRTKSGKPAAGDHKSRRQIGNATKAKGQRRAVAEGITAAPTRKVAAAGKKPPAKTKKAANSEKGGKPPEDNMNLPGWITEGGCKVR